MPGLTLRGRSLLDLVADRCDDPREPLVGHVAVKEGRVAQPQRRSRLDRDGRRRILDAIGLAAEGVGEHEAVVAGVEKRLSGIAGTIDHGGAHAAAVDRAGGIHPRGCATKDALFVRSAVAGEIAAAAGRRERCGESQPEAHLLGVAEDERRVASRREFRFPEQEADRNAVDHAITDRNARPLAAGDRRVGRVGGRGEILDLGREPRGPIHDGRLAVESDEPHGRFVPPGVGPREIGEAEPHAWVHRGVVVGVDALPRRAGPRDDYAARGREVADRGPPHGRVGEDERRHGLVTGGDHEPIGLAANREVGGRGMRCDEAYETTNQSAHRCVHRCTTS